MKIVSYNMHYGVGMDGKYDLARVLDAVRDADIIALQEVDSHWDRSGNMDQIELIRAQMPDHDLAYGSNVDVVKQDDRMGEIVRGCRRRSGNITLSRYPILTVRNFPLPKYGSAGPKLDIQKSLLEIGIDTPLGPLRVYNSHFCHLSDAQQTLQAEYVLDIHRRAPLEGSPLSGGHPKDPSFSSEPPLPAVALNAIILGDLNFRPNTAAYNVLMGDIGRQWQRVPRLGGFVDAWVAAGHPEQVGLGEVEEFGATSGDRLRRIDYCFVSEALSDRVVSAEVTYDAIGSDHFPLCIVME